MKSRSHKYARWFLLLAFALMALLYPVQRSIVHDPDYRNEYAQTIPITSIREGGTVALMAMMGGFRPVVANLLWLKTDAYWHLGGTGWWRIVPILRTICEMDPHFIDAWSTFAWHCAWNIYHDAEPQDKPGWIEAGIRVYKRGEYYNPDHYDLFKDEAWLYHDKLNDYDRAIPAWKKVLEFRDAPLYCRHMLAHAYEETWQVDKARAVWRDCLRRDPRDNVARSACEWWDEQTKTKAKTEAELKRILARRNAVRRSRGLPSMEQPRPFH